jgi:hypothetical protein
MEPRDGLNFIEQQRLGLFIIRTRFLSRDYLPELDHNIDNQKGSLT